MKFSPVARSVTSPMCRREAGQNLALAYIAANRASVIRTGPWD